MTRVCYSAQPRSQCMNKTILKCLTILTAASFLGACANQSTPATASNSVGTRNAGADGPNGAPVAGGGGQISEEPSGGGGNWGNGLAAARQRE